MPMPPPLLKPVAKERRKRRGIYPALFNNKRSLARTADTASKNSTTSFRLRKPLAAGGLYRGRRPPYWRSLAPALAGSGAVPNERLNGWLLVLAAKKIPHVHSPAGDRPRLYVPPLYESVALHEIRAFEQERPIPVFVPPKRDNLPFIILFLLLLAVWHGIRWGLFGFSAPSPPFPPEARGWSAAFGLDAYRTTVMGEWWRVITALTLHADDSHLFSNLGFGLIFLGALCRRAGAGLGIALAVLAGISGNACNALTREAHLISIGFSTSLFGALGSLCALAGADAIRHARRFPHAAASGILLPMARKLALPLAAGLALLGILGGGGEARTDYPAHIWGFCWGIILCIAALPLEKAVFSLPAGRQSAAQAGLFAATLALFALTWLSVL